MNTPEKLPIINCVVVTYNRLCLLQENILALKQQTFPLHKIFIINNCSTDGTHEFLDSLSNDSQMEIIHLPENKGGAWGCKKRSRLLQQKRRCCYSSDVAKLMFSS